MPIPTVLWAQRKDKLYVTIDVQDVKDQKTTLDNVDGVGKLVFSGKAGSEQQSYELELQLYKEIDVEASKIAVSARNIFLVIAKVEEGHWPRLTKDSGRHLAHVKCDWNKWVDEDEEDEQTDKFDPGQFNFSGFPGGGGMGGMGGMAGMEGMDFGEGPEEEEEDSDNEEALPDLVK